MTLARHRTPRSRTLPASEAAASASRCGAFETISAPANPSRSGGPAGRVRAGARARRPRRIPRRRSARARTRHASKRSRTCDDGAIAIATCAKRSLHVCEPPQRRRSCGTLGSQDGRRPLRRTAQARAQPRGQGTIDPAQQPRSGIRHGRAASTPMHCAHPASPGPSQRAERAIEQLAAVAHQPVVVQRQHDRECGAAPARRRSSSTGRSGDGCARRPGGWRR